MAPAETFDDALHPSADRPSRTEPQLVVVLECDRPMAGGARFSLSGVQEVRIGRGDRREAGRTSDSGYTTLHLKLPGRSLSSAHARLVSREGQWIVEDAPSRNGTFVNGARVHRAAVGGADVLEIGRALLVVREAMDLRTMPSDLDSSALAGLPLGMRTLLPALADSFRELARVARSTVPVLLLGDTGTGKEILARAVHALSERTGEIVAVNCGALSPTLLDAQLFGHTRGAFSGAVRDEAGFVRSADRGTLFLDEVGDLPRASQTALLRVIQESEVVPLGSTKPVKLDLRVVSATLRSLQLGDDGFRSDLFARLAGFVFRLPPLRERVEDLGLLLADLLATLAPERAQSVTFAPDLARRFLSHPWPLNVRELKQGLQTALVLAAGHELLPEHFAGVAGPSEPTDASAPQPDGLSDEDARLRIALIARLREHGGNVSAVARAMGKAPMQVHRWMRRFAVDPKAFRPRA
jgi:DNA-binding NtrC family response regulator